MTEREIRTQQSRGFSLAEVLVAVALLSVILLALFGLVTGGVRRAYGGKKMTEATVLAKAVLERANVAQPQDLLGAASTDTSATKTWTKSQNNKLDASTSPAAETGSTTAITERNAWRALLRDSTIPAGSAAAPATLTVTMTALPGGASGRTFANAATIRIEVSVTWIEWGTRPREVRLQTFNVRSTAI